MNIQRKELTHEQKKEICKKHEHIPGKWPCEGCPLKTIIYNISFCYQNMDMLTHEIEKFWNEEVEI